MKNPGKPRSSPRSTTENPMSITLIKECNRMQRQYNIAVVLSNLIPGSTEAAINSTLLRTLIRKKLNLPVLDGEKMHGDIRAHSDACGGHGFKFDQREIMVKNRTVREILLNKPNLDKCLSFIKKYADGSISGSGDCMSASKAAKILGITININK